MHLGLKRKLIFVLMKIFTVCSNNVEDMSKYRSIKYRLVSPKQHEGEIIK